MIHYIVVLYLLLEVTVFHGDLKFILHIVPNSIRLMPFFTHPGLIGLVLPTLYLLWYYSYLVLFHSQFPLSFILLVLLFCWLKLILDYCRPIRLFHVIYHCYCVICYYIVVYCWYDPIVDCCYWWCCWLIPVADVIHCYSVICSDADALTIVTPPSPDVILPLLRDQWLTWPCDCYSLYVVVFYIVILPLWYDPFVGLRIQYPDWHCVFVFGIDHCWWYDYSVLDYYDIGILCIIHYLIIVDLFPLFPFYRYWLTDDCCCCIPQYSEDDLLLLSGTVPDYLFHYSILLLFELCSVTTSTIYWCSDLFPIVIIDQYLFDSWWLFIIDTVMTIDWYLIRDQYCIYSLTIVLLLLFQLID